MCRYLDKFNGNGLGWPRMARDGLGIARDVWRLPKMVRNGRGMSVMARNGLGIAWDSRDWTKGSQGWPMMAGIGLVIAKDGRGVTTDGWDGQSWLGMARG